MTEVLRCPDGIIIIDPEGKSAKIPTEQIMTMANGAVQAWLDTREGRPLPEPVKVAGAGEQK